MNCDYTGPNYSPEDLRSVIDAMCKSLESSGQIDEHEHPSAYSTLLDTAKWMAELEGQEPVQLDEPDYHWEAMGCGLEDRNITDRYEAMKHGWDCAMDRMFEQISEPLYARPVPAEPVNARLLAVATGKIPHLYEGRCPDYVNGPESRDPDCPACQAIAEAEAQQERLLQDMHDAGREIDRVMAGAAQKAVRLTEAEVAAALNLFSQPSSLMLKITHDIETAVLRKNGIEVAE